MSSPTVAHILHVRSLAILAYFARKNPNAFWVGVLYFRQHGPRTDTKFMGKKVLYESSRIFMLSALCLLTMLFVISQYIGEREDLQLILLSLQFAISLLFMMSIGAGLYLLIRGLTRKEDYIPPEA